MTKPDRSYLVTVPAGALAGAPTPAVITGETFFFARDRAALRWSVEPGEIRIAGGKAGGA